MNIYRVTTKDKTLTINASTEFQALKTAQSILNMHACSRYGTPLGLNAEYINGIKKGGIV